MSTHGIVSSSASCWNCPAITLTPTRAAVVRIRKLPRRSTARWKCETAPVCSRSVAARPKSVRMPVAVTTALLSPWRAIKPEPADTMLAVPIFTRSTGASSRAQIARQAPSHVTRAANARRCPCAAMAVSAVYSCQKPTAALMSSSMITARAAPCSHTAERIAAILIIPGMGPGAIQSRHRMLPTAYSVKTFPPYRPRRRCASLSVSATLGSRLATPAGTAGSGLVVSPCRHPSLRGSELAAPRDGPRRAPGWTVRVDRCARRAPAAVRISARPAARPACDHTRPGRCSSKRAPPSGELSTDRLPP